MSQLFNPRGGFSFDLCARNEHMNRKPKMLKTGTTIMGLCCRDAVILAADSRATNEAIVADKNCRKIHYIAPNIYCCGAGTAADTEYATMLCSSKLELLRLNSGDQSRVKTADTVLCQLLFPYQGHISAALILGGVDCEGSHLFTIYPHGSTSISKYTTMGSGSLAAMSVLERGYREDMSVEEGKILARNAVCAGILNDMGSGSVVNVTVIYRDHVENIWPFHKPVSDKSFDNPSAHTFPVGTTPVVKTRITKYISDLDVKVVSTPKVGSTDDIEIE